MNRGAGIPKARKRGSVFGSGSRQPAESLAWSPRQPDLRTAEAELLRRSWASGGRRFQTHRRALRRWWRAGVFLGGERRPDTCRPSLAAFPTVGRPRAAGEILSCSPQWTIGGRSGLRRPGRRTSRLPPGLGEDNCGSSRWRWGRGEGALGTGSSCGSHYYFRETPRKAGHARVGGPLTSYPIG